MDCDIAKHNIRIKAITIMSVLVINMLWRTEIQILNLLLLYFCEKNVGLSRTL